ncbi:MAG: HAMP domain-containing histidine kinase [Blautia sp.]|nr:HAMP domain-containing histidine kinase [Lachnoclostridium sp.]MCM1212814.1 HAMP domain-containing histidine kinase [Blautia sp.]
MGMKKIRFVFMRYVLVLAVSLICTVFGNVSIYLLGVAKEVIYPLNYVSAEMEKTKEFLQTAHTITEDEIPLFCEYALFTNAGGYQSGSLDRETAQAIWIDCMENQIMSATPYRYTVVQRADEVLILRYRIAAQFSNALLRKLFPAADWVFVGVIVFEMLLWLFVISYWFGKYVDKKMDTLLTATQKIEQQDLDFTVEGSDIFEIDKALNGLEHMKQALKQSLSKQWEAEKMRQEQIAALAHDLKTPLTIVRGNVELLYDTALSDVQKECADYIKNSSFQMQDYIQTLIDITKSTDNFRPQIQKVTLSDFLQELQKQTKGLCAAKGIQLQLVYEYQTQHVHIDYDLLMRALLNVISNAIEHTPTNGIVSLTVKESDGYFVFIIRDTGSGFSAEALKHAAEQFYMGDKSRNSDTHFGMGLYITDLVIKQHHGQLTFTNSEKTGGAEVTIAIPY